MKSKIVNLRNHAYNILDMKNKLLRLVFGIFCIWCFIVVIVPFLTQNEASQQMLNHIEENDIDTRALFYTDSEEAKDAEFLLRSKKLHQIKDN